MLIEITSDGIQSCAKNMPRELAVSLCNQLCMSLEKHGHANQAEIVVTDQTVETHNLLSWKYFLTPEEAVWYADGDDRVEASAIALAVVLLHLRTDYIMVARSNKGTRIDFYIEPKNNDPTEEETYILDGYAEEEIVKTQYVEVSGIDVETPSNTIARRRAEKIRRLDEPDGPGSGNGTTYIAISELSRPAFDLYLS